jgi:hypothetical protein
MRARGQVASARSRRHAESHPNGPFRADDGHVALVLEILAGLHRERRQPWLLLNMPQTTSMVCARYDWEQLSDLDAASEPRPVTR